MMWLLLFALTTLVVLLPMLPALLEWWRPTDVTPLFIDQDDALDPPFLARSFAARLAEALASRKTHLGRSSIATLPPHGDWRFSDREVAAASTRRVWNVLADAELPAGVSFLGEVAARQSLRAAPGGVYRALWVRGHLTLPAGCTLLRWAHAARIDVGAGVDLCGRVTADERITLAHGARFTLLHAGALHFGPLSWVAPTPPRAVFTGTSPGLPPSVTWHDGTGRCDVPLRTEAGCAWSGDLVCTSDLRLGSASHVQGSLKAHGRLTLEAGCVVEGSIFACGAITLQAGCTVWGAVVSEAAIVLGPGCLVGERGRASTVAAPRIDIDAGVTVHGTVWAGEEGLCSGADAAVEPPPDSAHPSQPASLPEALA